MDDRSIQTPRASGPPDEVMSVRQVADYLGVSGNVVRSLLRSRKLKAFKAGGQWRVWRNDLTDFVMAQLQRP